MINGVLNTTLDDLTYELTAGVYLAKRRVPSDFICRPRRSVSCCRSKASPAVRSKDILIIKILLDFKAFDESHELTVHMLWKHDSAYATSRCKSQTCSSHSALDSMTVRQPTSMRLSVAKVSKGCSFQCRPVGH